MSAAIPTLETERLVLRGWRESDFEGYASLMADPVGSRFVGGPLAREDAWRKMAAIAGHWILRGYGTFVVVGKSSGDFIGYCGPWFPYGFPEPEIGWALLPSAQRQGYATEAARRARAYAYDELRWTTAISVIAAENSASLRVAERLDARPDGTTDIRGKRVQIWRHPAPTRH